jgi:hypothetical protein
MESSFETYFNIFYGKVSRNYDFFFFKKTAFKHILILQIDWKSSCALKKVFGNSRKLS